MTTRVTANPPVPTFAAQISQITPATPSINLLQLRLIGNGFEFLPGQWIEVSVDQEETRETSAFSISSAPNTHGLIELAMRHTDGSPVSNYLRRIENIGQTVILSGARGDMGFDPETIPGDIVLIGGGTGIAPLMSILRHAMKKNGQRNTVLFYSARNREELLFAEEVRRLQIMNPHFHSIITLTREDNPSWQGRTGRIDEAVLDQTTLSPNATYFLCGPPAMVDDIVLLLMQRKVPASHLRYDKWW